MPLITANDAISDKITDSQNKPLTNNRYGVLKKKKLHTHLDISLHNIILVLISAFSYHVQSLFCNVQIFLGISIDLIFQCVHSVQL